MAGIRSEMVTLLSPFNESVKPAKKACIDDSIQSTTYHPMLTISYENQRLAQTNGNQCAITSCGDEFSAIQMPSRSIEFGLAMAMASNPASPVAKCYISTHSAEEHFVLTLQNIQRKISNTAGQGLLVDSAINFAEDESLGQKIPEVFAKYVEDCCSKKIHTEFLKLKDGFQCPENCLACTYYYPNLWGKSRSTFKMHCPCFQGPNGRGAGQ